MENIKKISIQCFMKRTVSLLLVFILSFSFLLCNIDFKVFAAGEHNQTGGDCSAAGDNSLQWRLEDNNSTLIIEGYGAMQDYDNTDSPAPWHEEKDIIEEIVFVSNNEEGGITHIGDYAFKDFTALTEVGLPSSLESIGKYAFKDTINLETLYVIKD